MVLSAPIPSNPHERIPLPPKVTLYTPEIDFFPPNHRSTVLPRKLLRMLGFSENQHQLSLALLVIALPRTSDYVLLSSPSSRICQAHLLLDFWLSWYFPFKNLCAAASSHPCPGRKRLCHYRETHWAESTTAFQPWEFIVSNSSSRWCLSSNYRVSGSSVRVSMPVRSRASAHQNHFWDSREPWVCRGCHRTMRNKPVSDWASSIFLGREKEQDIIACSSLWRLAVKLEEPRFQVLTLSCRFPSLEGTTLKSFQPHSSPRHTSPDKEVTFVTKLGEGTEHAQRCCSVWCRGGLSVPSRAVSPSLLAPCDHTVEHRPGA